MIVFDLRCAAGHVFEFWFGSSAGYEDQRARGLVACPLCGDTAIDKAVMAPNVGAKGNSRSSGEVPPSAMKAAMAALAKAQAKALEGSTWVGAGFAGEARAMHLGERTQEAIHGQATVSEAKALVEEGISIMPLPLPIIPPDRAN